MGIAEVIALLTGVSLFLFGMTLMGEGLKKVSGNRLEPILFRLSGTPVRGVLLGTGVTAVIQSSSATSVMVVGFVNSGIMKTKQAISVILGAIFGTCVTGWVVCLSYLNGPAGISSLLSTATLTGLIAVVGILLRMFSKNPTQNHLGDVLMGFAVLMVGLSGMSSAVGGLGEQPWFTSMLTTMSHPIAGILVGIVFAAVLQSASAAVGILQALSVTGAMTLEAAFPLLMGITIGASVPVLLSALGANTEGKRTAFSYLSASFLGVMACASIFYIGNAIVHFSFMNMTMDPFSLALVNTFLRLAMLLLQAPFTDVLEATSALIIPDRAPAEVTGIQLEDRFLSHPALAVEQSRITICDMARQTEEAMAEAISLISRYSESGFRQVEELEDSGDQYEDALGSYLVKLTGQELTAQQGRMSSLFLHTLTDFERISDHALVIAKSAREISEKHVVFSKDAAHELSVLTAAVEEILDTAISAFLNQDDQSAARVEPMGEVIDQLCDEMKLRHVERLQDGRCTIEHGFVLNDLITNFKRVSDHCSNIAVALIELGNGSFDTHEYLGTIREKRSPDFEHYYEMYREKYSL